MVSNLNATATTGSLEFTKVGNGTFACNGLLGTPSGTLTVKNNAGSLPITVDERDTIVFEIPGLQWLGHTGTSSASAVKAATALAVAVAPVAAANHNQLTNLNDRATDGDYLYMLDRASASPALLVFAVAGRQEVARLYPEEAASNDGAANDSDYAVKVVSASDGGVVIVASPKDGTGPVYRYRWAPPGGNPGKD